MNKNDVLSLQMHELQMYGKAMLENIVTIFEKHGITYYAGFGTVLGAVRHNDFIPWDHDIDLSVPITERERMIEVLRNNLNPEFRLCTPGDDGYALMYTRVALAGKRHEFLHIDIYDIVGFPQNRKEQEKAMNKAIRIDRLLHNKYYLHFSKNNSVLGRIKVALLKLQSALVPEKMLRKQYEELLHQWNYSSSDYITVLIEPYGIKKIFEKTIFGDGIHRAFGGLSLTIPLEYDAYLTQIYGKYMEYPQKEHIDSMLKRTWIIENI